MSAIVVVLTLLLLAAVIAVVSSPLRAARGSITVDSSERGELLAAREAKYREIRDAELDYRTGKLSSQDFEAINGTLRAEALEILDRLEALERTEPEASSTERIEPEASSALQRKPGEEGTERQQGRR